MNSSANDEHPRIDCTTADAAAECEERNGEDGEISSAEYVGCLGVEGLECRTTPGVFINQWPPSTKTGFLQGEVVCVNDPDVVFADAEIVDYGWQCGGHNGTFQSGQQRGSPERGEEGPESPSALSLRISLTGISNSFLVAEVGSLVFR